MKLTNTILLAAVMFSAACGVTASEREDFYTDVPDEAALTSDEVALLPDGTEVEHANDLSAALATEGDETDAATFDDTEVAEMTDVEVTDDIDGTTTPVYQAAILKWGLHPRASDAFRAAGVTASRIMQTIGNASASAGTHAQDGSVNGHPYSAATDVSVSGLSQTQIANLLERLAKVGFAAWYRHSGHDGWYGVDHIHAVYANSKMKSSLRSQVRSWLVGRNGLVSNSIYSFHHFSAAARAAVNGKYAMSHQGTSNGSGGGISARVNTHGIALHVRSSASLSASIVSTVSDGSYITMTCQKRGSSVTGTYGTTTLWDKINGGYVSDAFIATGSDGQVAPTCN